MLLYLKRFNESNIFSEELISFCNNYLASIIDDGFIIKKYSENNDYVILRLIKIKKYADRNRRYDTTSDFKWNSIKDSFIPFFKVLDDNYRLSLKEYTNYHGPKVDSHWLENNKVIFYKNSGLKVFGNNINIMNDIFSKSFKKSDLVAIDICVVKN